MATITKKELIDRIAESSNQRRVQVKKVVQQFLDEIVNELGKGNRLEFRDFGVFETKIRKARKAQNPKTLEPVAVPEKRTVKFKVGRLMKQRLGEMTGAAIDDEAGDIAEMAEAAAADEGPEDEDAGRSAAGSATGAGGDSGGQADQQS
jgi:integration host factor subunit beta